MDAYVNQHVFNFSVLGPEPRQIMRTTAKWIGYHWRTKREYLEKSKKNRKSALSHAIGGNFSSDLLQSKA